MAVGGLRVQLQLLLARQIPVRVKPVRVARGQEKFLGAVGFGQFGLRGFENVARAASGRGRNFSPGPLAGGGAGWSPSSKMAGTSIFLRRV